MTPRKRLHNLWARELKAALAGITWCERCGSNGLIIDIAHSKKRYDIKDKTDYFTAVKLCRSCHEFAEFGKHDRMEEIIQEIIEKRSVDTMTA